VKQGKKQVGQKSIPSEGSCSPNNFSIVLAQLAATTSHISFITPNVMTCQSLEGDILRKLELLGGLL